VTQINDHRRIIFSHDVVETDEVSFVIGDYCGTNGAGAVGDVDEGWNGGLDGVGGDGADCGAFFGVAFGGMER